MLILAIVLPLVYFSGLFIFLTNIIGSNKKLRAFLEWIPLFLFWILCKNIYIYIFVNSKNLFG